MCGIAGSVNFSFEPEQALQMLSHRGPDSQTHTQIENVQLLHARLSIIDSVGGVQPMRRGNKVVVYNGEIYNHQKLRKQYSLECTTQSDTETFLLLYEKLGLACLDVIDGMFAFAIFDLDTHMLVLARDRAGEKPLYIKQFDNQLTFASELAALNTIHKLEIDDNSVNQYLAAGVFFGSHTAYKQVLECPAGSYMEIDTTTMQTKLVRWYHFGKTQQGVDSAQPQNLNLSSELDVVDLLDRHLHESVQDRLLSSDVEVGAFLSGGIDSGLITAIASQYTDALKTFTVSFDGQFDESELASAVAQKYNTDHHVLSVNYDKLDQDIESILLNYGEPICDDSVIPTWYVSRAAKEHVTVALTGDGADELFGGYRRYVPYAQFNLFNRSGDSSVIAKWVSAVLPHPTTKMGYYNYIHRLVELLRKSGLDRYLATTIDVNPDALIQLERFGDLEQCHNRLANAQYSSLAKLMTMDFHTLLAGALLPKMDIGSMAHSLESRSPFLSVKLLQLAPQLNDGLKVRGKTTKYALRKLSARYLPIELQSAPKRGFETPLSSWVDGRLKSVITDSLGDPNGYVRQFYQAGFIDELLKGHARMSNIQRIRTIWMLYCVEVWARKFKAI